MHASTKVLIEFLWPRQEPLRLRAVVATTNGNSIVLHLTYGNFTMLFNGDLNTKSEKELMDVLRTDTVASMF